MGLNLPARNLHSWLYRWNLNILRPACAPESDSRSSRSRHSFPSTHRLALEMVMALLWGAGFSWANPSPRKGTEPLFSGTRSGKLRKQDLLYNDTMLFSWRPWLVGRIMSAQIHPVFNPGWFTLTLHWLPPIKKKKSDLNMNISSLLRAVVSETLASLLLSFLMPHTSPGSTNIVFSPLGFVFCSCPALTPSLYLFNRYLCRVWPYAKQGSKCFIYINSFISHTKHMW